jgi:hypothetical protein
LPADTDAGEADLAIRGNGTGTTEHGGREDERGGGLEELAAAEGMHVRRRRLTSTCSLIHPAWDLVTL